MAALTTAMRLRLLSFGKRLAGRSGSFRAVVIHNDEVAGFELVGRGVRRFRIVDHNRQRQLSTAQREGQGLSTLLSGKDSSPRLLQGDRT